MRKIPRQIVIISEMTKGPISPDVKTAYDVVKNTHNLETYFGPKPFTMKQWYFIARLVQQEMKNKIA